MLNKALDWVLGREPVATATGLAGVVTAAFGLLHAFDVLRLTPEQVAAIGTLLAVVAGWAARQAVSPVANVTERQYERMKKKVAEEVRIDAEADAELDESGGVFAGICIAFAVVFLILFAFCVIAGDESDEGSWAPAQMADNEPCSEEGACQGRQGWYREIWARGVGLGFASTSMTQPHSGAGCSLVMGVGSGRARSAVRGMGASAGAATPIGMPSFSPMDGCQRPVSRSAITATTAAACGRTISLKAPAPTTWWTPAAKAEHEALGTKGCLPGTTAERPTVSGGTPLTRSILTSTPAAGGSAELAVTGAKSNEPCKDEGACQNRSGDCREVEKGASCEDNDLSPSFQDSPVDHSFNPIICVLPDSCRFEGQPQGGST